MKARFLAYLCEFAGVAIMMAIGVSAIVLLWAPDSPLPVIATMRLRLLCTGAVFAAAKTLLIYSPLGRVSGAHLNPAVTTAFWRLRRIDTRDALAYAAAQTAGAVAGVATVAVTVGGRGRAVNLGMTIPGAGVSAAAACGYEAVVTFFLVFLILHSLSWPRLAPFTGLFVGLVMPVLVMLDGPLTGAILNPARSVGPALVMASFHGLWIYLVAPPVGALVAALAWRGRWAMRQSLICAKLYHGGESPCRFPTCPYVAYSAGQTIVREGDAGDCAFVIEAGEVEVRRGLSGREIVLARLEPGDWFGEMSVLLHEPRSASIVALTDVRARRLTREAFEQAVADDPVRSRALLRQLASRLRDTDLRLEAPRVP